MLIDIFYTKAIHLKHFLTFFLNIYFVKIKKQTYIYMNENELKKRKI
jgi:hypothetical protein